MAWLKTIDGDFINLDSGVCVVRNWDTPNGIVGVEMLSKSSNSGIVACNGNEKENSQYMEAFEDLLDAEDEIIIDPS